MVHLVFLRNSGSFHSSGSLGRGVSSLSLQYSYNIVSEALFATAAQTYHSVDLIDSSGHVRRLETHRGIGLQHLGEVETVIEIVTTRVRATVACRTPSQRAFPRAALRI